MGVQLSYTPSLHSHGQWVFQNVRPQYSPWRIVDSIVSFSHFDAGRDLGYQSVAVEGIHLYAHRVGYAPEKHPRADDLLRALYQVSQNANDGYDYRIEP